MREASTTKRIVITTAFFGLVAAAGTFMFAKETSHGPQVSADPQASREIAQVQGDVAQPEAAAPVESNPPESNPVESRPVQTKIATPKSLRPKPASAKSLQTPAFEHGAVEARTEPSVSPSVKTSTESRSAEPSPMAFVPSPNSGDLSETKAPNFWLWLGSGMNFQYYKQTVPSVEGQATFNNIQGPTALLEAGFQGETFGVEASYKDTPGRMDSSADVTVTNGSYHWRTLSLEGLYRFNDAWNLRFGVQHHLMPFMDLNPLTSNIDVKTNTLTMLTAGFDKSYLLTKDLRAEWNMRYQLPVVSGSSDGIPFNVKSRFAFDGALGGIYNLSQRSRLGLFWYGQWHQYDFDYGRAASKLAGDQTLFYSSIEVRLGLEF